MLIKNFVICLLISVLAACGGGGSGGGSVPESTEPRNITCDDYREHDTPLGRLANNVWNKQAAGTFLYTQCLTVKGAGTNKTYGWKWNWPIGNWTVYAYPEIVLGWKPWRGADNTDTRFPKKVSAINKFDWRYSVDMNVNGKTNLVTSMWLTSSGATSQAPNPLDITTEFMIWTDGYTFNPSGSMVGFSTIDGEIYEVWYSGRQLDASGVNSNTWKYVTYRSLNKKLSASIDIKQILNDAVIRNLISQNEYVSNIELGNEVMSGSGETWINSLYLDLQ